MNYNSKPIDLNGKEIQIGDKVVFGDTTSSYNAVVNYGEVLDVINKGKIQTIAIVKVLKVGGCNKHSIGKHRYFIFPRNYSNLIVI